MCGIVGEVIFDQSREINIASRLKNAGQAIQYRGYESAGTVLFHKGRMKKKKFFGEVATALAEPWVERKGIGESGIFQNLYGTTGLGGLANQGIIRTDFSSDDEYEKKGIPALANLQPFYDDSRNFAIVHNGNLINAKQLKNFLIQKGVTDFAAQSDTEIILKLIIYFLKIKRKKKGERKIITAIKAAMQKMKGAYSCIFLTKEGLYAFRDQYGIRPLKIAKTNDSFIFASEPIAWHERTAQYVRNVKPGEIVYAKIGEQKLISYRGLKAGQRNFCIFEDIYLQAGYNDRVSLIRQEFGEKLFERHPFPGIVIPIMNSGEMSAIGYLNAQSENFPGKSYWWPALYKNPFVGRSFLEPIQKDRILKIKKKYFNLFRGIEKYLYKLAKTEKNLWLIFIDDSLIRANVSRTLVIQIIRETLKSLYPDLYHRIKIAWLLSSPPYVNPCYFGVDTYDKNELIASAKSIKQIQRSIRATHVGYLTHDDITTIAAKIHKLKKCDFCTGCFLGGKYPMKIDPNVDKQALSA
jgi:amidophosphoribosyltransferase